MHIPEDSFSVLVDSGGKITNKCIITQTFSILFALKYEINRNFAVNLLIKI